MNIPQSELKTPIQTQQQSFLHMLLQPRRGWWVSSARHGTPDGVHWLWTGLFSTGIAIVLTLFFIVFQPGRSVLDTFLGTWVMSLCIGYSIHVLFELALRVIKPERFSAWPKPRRTLLFIVVPLAGIFMGYALAFGLKGRNLFAIVTQYPRDFFGLFMIVGIVAVIWHLLIDTQSTRYKRETELAQERERQAALQRQASVAELRALQSQIEPHFLFNTLANVQSLIDYDAPLAKRMLEAFIEYLRASLDANRRTQATVGDELQVLEHYLRLLKIRMGARLRYAIVADEATRSLPLPPLVLQPLVENAVKYGLEPKLEGGGISITARQSEGMLTLTVLDDGMGLDSASTARKGNGIALQNIRERLTALYGERATLKLESAELSAEPKATLSAQHGNQSGTLATITIPLDTKTS